MWSDRYDKYVDCEGGCIRGMVPDKIDLGQYSIDSTDAKIQVMGETGWMDLYSLKDQSDVNHALVLLEREPEGHRILFRNPETHQMEEY